MPADRAHFQLRSISSHDDRMKFKLHVSEDGESYTLAGELIMPVGVYFDLLEVLAKGGHRRCTILRKDQAVQHIEGLVT